MHYIGCLSHSHPDGMWTHGCGFLYGSGLRKIAVEHITTVLQERVFTDRAEVLDKGCFASGEQGCNFYLRGYGAEVGVKTFSGRGLLDKRCEDVSKFKSDTRTCRNPKFFKAARGRAAIQNISKRQ